MILLALATPVGIGLLGARPHSSFLLPRNLIASALPIALLAGWLVTSFRRRAAAIAATTALLLVLVVAAARALDASYRRSAYHAAAAFVDDRARPGDPVIEFFFAGDTGPLEQVLALNFATPHRIFHGRGETQAAAWRQGLRTGRAFVVVPLPGYFKRTRHLARFDGPGKRFELVAERRWTGIEDMLAGEYVVRR